MFNRREVLHHPTSLQSLVSSSAAGGVGASNPGLHLQGPQSGRQSRQDDQAHEEPIPSHARQTPEPQVHGSRHQQQYCSRSSSSRHGQRRSHRSLRVRSGIGSRSSRRRGLCHTRWALLAAFALILVGVVVTSSYAIDRRLAQMPQLLYTGLALCSVGLCIIVASVSVLVARQLGKQSGSLGLSPRQRHQVDQLVEHPQDELLGHSATAACANVSVARRQHQANSGAGEVPIWFIGCHRDTARPYYPPVPPSYWDSTASGTRASSSSGPPAVSSSLQPKPVQQPFQTATRLHLRPLPPPPPPSYQEALRLRCLEEGGQGWVSASRHQAAAQAVSCDQMSVLKWTVQARSHNHTGNGNYYNNVVSNNQSLSSRGSGVRRCESSSFIGEPILV